MSRPAVRDVLVVLLTLTTGAVDATSFLRLGNVFSSVITGNMVLLGVAAGTRAPALATHSGVALAGYATGVAIGAPIAARMPGRGGLWPPGVTAALAVEICVLAGFSAGWEVTGGAPGTVAQLLMVVAVAASMGIQSAAVRRLGQMSTTYLTSTLTGVVAGLVTGTRPEGLWRSVGVLAAVVVGAGAGAVAADEAPVLTPVLIIAPLLAVVIISALGFGQVRERLGGS